MIGQLIKTIKLINQAVSSLELDMPLSLVEKMSILINRAMTAQNRSFHTPEHIFDLAENDKPFQVFASLFHDIVYYHVDEGFIPEIQSLLQNFVDINPKDISLKKDCDDALVLLNAEIFDINLGDKLPPFGGMNEFLSSIVMSKMLEGYCDPLTNLRITALIEMTIPFRKTNKKGQTPPEQLADRIRKISDQHNFKLSNTDITKIVQEAVLFANKDVANFSESDVGLFLDNTWKLLPETNPALRVAGLYTIKSYRHALQKMEGFMTNLDPLIIFSSYKGVPTSSEFDLLHENASRNVKAAQLYLSIKLLTTGILECIAEISGGDVPVSLFMGELGDKEQLEQFENKLNSFQTKKTKIIQSQIHDLLSIGRSNSSSFDLKNSPLANFLYSTLGCSEYPLYLNLLKDVFSGKMKAKEFLNLLPDFLVVPIIKACAGTAITRQEILEDYLLHR